MSTKLYTVRLPKDRWWEFSVAVRATYLAEHPAVGEFRTKLAIGATYREAMATVETNTHMVELQLFDEGDTWLVRPLEQGWFFLNHIETKAWPGFNPHYTDSDGKTRCDECDRVIELVEYKEFRTSQWHDAP